MKSREAPRLLLADNNPSYRRSLSVLLELEDYLVDEAGNPDEAGCGSKRVILISRF